MRKLSSKKKVKKTKGKDEAASNENTDENLEANENGGKNDESSGDESDDNKTLKRKSKKDSAAEKKSDEEEEKAKSSDKEENDEGGDDADAEEYEVQDIVDHKIEKGQSFYLIRWKGWGADGDTWEAEDTLSCPDIIEKFKKKKEKKSSSAAKGGSGAASKGRKRKAADNGEKASSTTADDEKEWEVERVIDVAYEKGVRLFRIRWKGYKPSSDTWEPEEHLNCQDLIAKFLKKIEETDKLGQKDLREQPKKTQRFATDAYRRASKRNSGRSRAVYYDED